MGFSDSDRHANRQRYCNNIGNCNCYCYCRAEVHAVAQAAAYATSAPISSSV